MKKFTLLSLALAFASSSVFADVYMYKESSISNDSFDTASNWYQITDSDGTLFIPAWIQHATLDKSNNTGVYGSSAVSFTYKDATTFAPTSSDDIVFAVVKVLDSETSTVKSHNAPKVVTISNSITANNFMVRNYQATTFKLKNSSTGDFAINLSGVLATEYNETPLKFIIDDTNTENKYSIYAKALYARGDVRNGNCRLIQFGDENRAFDEIIFDEGTMNGTQPQNSYDISFFAKKVIMGGTYTMRYNIAASQDKQIANITTVNFSNLVATTKIDSFDVGDAIFNVGGKIIIDDFSEYSEKHDVFILDFANAGITDESNGVYNLVYAVEGYEGFDTENANLVYGFTIKNLNLTEGNYEFIMNDNMLQLAVGSAVPEPSTIAGITGLLALAFAAYRRRK